MRTILKNYFFLTLLPLLFIAGKSKAQNSRADSLANTFVNHPTQIMVAAHRCAHQNFPENSIGALKEAIRLGIDIAEIDIRQTKDHVLVIMHDEKVNRTTTGKGELASYTYKQLKELRLLHDSKPTAETVPTLEEFLLTAKGKILVDLDFKADDEDALKRTYQTIKKTNTLNQVLFFLYGYKDLLEVNKINPAIKIMPRAYNQSDVENILAMKIAKVIHIDESFYSDSLMRTIRDQKVRIWSNSLGKYDDLQIALNTGFQTLLTNTKYVNVIQTNLPEEWLKYLKQKGLH